jgi:hypothetical protein
MLQRHGHAIGSDISYGFTRFGDPMNSPWVTVIFTLLLLVTFYSSLVFLWEPPDMTSLLFDTEGGSIMFSEIVLVFCTSRGCCTQKILQWLWECYSCCASLNMPLWIIVNVKVSLWELRFPHQCRWRLKSSGIWHAVKW